VGRLTRKVFGGDATFSTGGLSKSCRKPAHVGGAATQDKNPVRCLAEGKMMR